MLPASDDEERRTHRRFVCVGGWLGGGTTTARLILPIHYTYTRTGKTIILYEASPAMQHGKCVTVPEMVYASLHFSTACPVIALVYVRGLA